MNKKITAVVGAAVVMGLLVPALSLAATFKGGKTVSVGPSEAISDNAYLGGGTVSVQGAVKGDLFAGGGTVTISGKVDQDIFAAGGTVIISNATAQDVRVSGGNLTVDGAFTGELLAGGGNITVMQGTTITKDSYLGGGDIMFSGIEAGNLMTSGGSITIDGTVSGNLTIGRAQTVVIKATAVIKKNFEYSAASPATIEAGAKILGTTTFHQVAPPAAAQNAHAVFIGFITAWWFVKLLMALTAAYLIWYLRKKDVVEGIGYMRSRFGRELLRGFLFMVATPIAVVILFITVIGLIPGLIALLTYIALLILCVPLTGIFTASLIVKGRTDLRWYHVLLGVAVFSLLTLIPFVGWILCAVLYCSTLGSLLSVLKTKF